MMLVPAVLLAENVPEAPSMLPTVALLLLQVPPVTALCRVVERLRHTLVAPVIDAVGFTVIVVVVIHPVGSVYVIDTDPPEIPVTTPVDPTMAAMALLPLVHVPPVAEVL